MGRQGETTRQQRELLALLARDILLHRQLPSGGWWADDLTVNGKTANSLLDAGWITPLPRETTGHRATYRITSEGRREAERLAKARTLTAMERDILTGLQRGVTLWRFVAEAEWQQGGATVDAATCHRLLENKYITINRAGETMQRSGYMLTARGTEMLEASHAHQT